VTDAFYFNNNWQMINFVHFFRDSRFLFVFFWLTKGSILLTKGEMSFPASFLNPPSHTRTRTHTFPSPPVTHSRFLFPVSHSRTHFYSALIPCMWKLLYFYVQLKNESQEEWRKEGKKERVWSDWHLEEEQRLCGLALDQRESIDYSENGFRWICLLTCSHFLF